VYTVYRPVVLNQGRSALAERLANRAALLVLDAVWNRLDVNAFDVFGPRCRALITTRDIEDAYAIEPNHRSVWQAIHVSVATLPDVGDRLDYHGSPVGRGGWLRTRLPGGA
jgi:hypothetical protein